MKDWVRGIGFGFSAASLIIGTLLEPIIVGIGFILLVMTLGFLYVGEVIEKLIETQE